MLTTPTETTTTAAAVYLLLGCLIAAQVAGAFQPQAQPSFSASSFAFVSSSGAAREGSKRGIFRRVLLSSALEMSSKNNNNNNNAFKSDDLFVRWANKQTRAAGANDVVVELNRPLGVVLQEDKATGNVYVETVAPNGNAARSGQVKEGDVVTMCSATFGDAMWSTKGVGLTRVLAAIRVRSGATVKLVLESPNQLQKSLRTTQQQAQQRAALQQAAQAKRDALLAQLERDEETLNPKKFFGLF